MSAVGRIASGIGQAFWNGLRSVVSDIGNLGKTMYNAIVDTINNGLIDPIKNWHFTIGAFGIHHTFQPFGGIPEIPRLALGGLVQGPGTFMMGDNPSGQELALPLDSPKTRELLGHAVSAALGSHAGLNGGTLTLPTDALRDLAAHGPTVAELSAEDRELLHKLAHRPVSVQVDKKQVAWAANDGNLELARRSGGTQ